MLISETKFRILVKPNVDENKIESFGIERSAFRISIKAKPQDNKANIELIKFLSKTLKKKVKIISGLKSKEKIIQVTN